MTIASLVILTSSPHIWNSHEIATGVSKEKWEEMTKFGVGFENEENEFGKISKNNLQNKNEPNLRS